MAQNNIDQDLRDAHDAREDDNHPAAFKAVYDQWLEFRAAQLKAVLQEAGYGEGTNQGDRATTLLRTQMIRDALLLGRHVQHLVASVASQGRLPVATGISLCLYLNCEPEAGKESSGSLAFFWPWLRE